LARRPAGHPGVSRLFRAFAATPASPSPWRTPRPVITGIGPVPGWEDPDNWTRVSEDGSIWSIYYGPWKVAKRVWLSGDEYAAAQVPADVDATYRWHYDYETETLYVYTGGPSPAACCTSIEEAMAASGSVLQFRARDYVTVRDLDLRGGHTCVSVLGSNHVTLADCNLGWGSGSMAVWVSRLNPDDASDYGIIRRCLVDSGYHLPYYWEKAQTEDGIHLRDNADHWRIHDNDIRDWGHTGIDLWQASEGTTVSHNTICRNTFTARNISYGRAFSTKGRPGGCHTTGFATTPSARPVCRYRSAATTTSCATTSSTRCSTRRCMGIGARRASP